MKRYTTLAAVVASLLTLASPASAMTRETLDLHDLTARWSRIAFAPGGSERTLTRARVQTYGERVWLDLDVSVERCASGVCTTQATGTALTIGTPADLAFGRVVVYAAQALVSWTDAAGLPSGQTLDDVTIGWDPTTRLVRDTERIVVDDCRRVRTTTREGPAIATGSIGDEALGESLVADVRLVTSTTTERC